MVCVCLPTSVPAPVPVPVLVSVRVLCIPPRALVARPAWRHEKVTMQHATGRHRLALADAWVVAEAQGTQKQGRPRSRRTLRVASVEMALELELEPAHYNYCSKHNEPRQNDSILNHRQPSFLGLRQLQRGRSAPPVLSPVGVGQGRGKMCSVWDYLGAAVHAGDAGDTGKA